MQSHFKTVLISGAGLLLLTGYVVSYAVWSRSSAERARALGSEGFHFFQQTGPDVDPREMIIRTFYAPCISFDVEFLNGMPPSYSRGLNDLS